MWAVNNVNVKWMHQKYFLSHISLLFNNKLFCVHIFTFFNNFKNLLSASAAENFCHRPLLNYEICSDVHWYFYIKERLYIFLLARLPFQFGVFNSFASLTNDLKSEYKKYDDNKKLDTHSLSFFTVIASLLIYILYKLSKEWMLFIIPYYHHLVEKYLLHHLV